MALFIGKIPREMDNRDLEEKFSKFGKITRLNVKTGFGFVEFEDKRDAEEVLQDINLKDEFGIEWAKNGGKRLHENECFKCGVDGHWARDCPDGDRDGGRGGGFRRGGRGGFGRDRSPRREYGRDRGDRRDYDRRDGGRRDDRAGGRRDDRGSGRRDDRAGGREDRAGGREDRGDRSPRGGREDRGRERSRSPRRTEYRDRSPRRDSGRTFRQEDRHNDRAGGDVPALQQQQRGGDNEYRRPTNTGDNFNNGASTSDAPNNERDRY